ncbi:MAG TPA: hypothetical protein VGO69_03980 [Pyrinomonadaceae bacterium]|nr:hypothetical protein [Pyrinomonadaceae bacterium]
MDSPLSKILETVAGLFVVIALAMLMSVEARGQVTVGLPLPAPPPLRLVPRDERLQLDAARDTKARMRLSVELAEARLARAEQMTSAQQYESASRELGIYQGILDDALRFLKDQKEQKKLRDTYKRFEIALRAHGMRLETMRRTTPSEYAFNIKTITEYTKNLRGEALNGFYGDNVIRDTPNDEAEKAPEEGKTTTPSQSLPKEQP